jgi:hypothetical protein
MRGAPQMISRRQEGPIATPVKPKKLGLLKGKIKIPADFDAPMDWRSSKGAERAYSFGYACAVVGARIAGEAFIGEPKAD